MDGMPMHRACRPALPVRLPRGDVCMPRWEMPRNQTVVRITAVGDDEAWCYTFPPELWRVAVKRIIADMRKEKLPEAAASGLVSMIAEGMSHAH